MVFLVAAVSFTAKNLTAFLIVESLIEGYMLIAPTHAIVTSSLFTSSSSSISFILMIGRWKHVSISLSTHLTSSLSQDN